jgi:small-conductance mechanosensitive channel
VLSDSDIASMTTDERVSLSRRLAAFNTELVRDTDASRRRRRRIINLLILSCLLLIPWIVVLGLTLPHRYSANHWAVAWVGYDVVLLLVLAFTAWAAWRRRQVVIMAALVSGTMLVVDAWFDIVTDSTTRDLVLSIVTACIAEIPLAIIMFSGALRLVRLTTHTTRSLAGEESDPHFWKVPLFSIDPVD